MKAIDQMFKFSFNVTGLVLLCFICMLACNEKRVHAKQDDSIKQNNVIYTYVQYKSEKAYHVVDSFVNCHCNYNYINDSLNVNIDNGQDFSSSLRINLIYTENKFKLIKWQHTTDIKNPDSVVYIQNAIFKYEKNWLAFTFKEVFYDTINVKFQGSIRCPFNLLETLNVKDTHE